MKICSNCGSELEAGQVCGCGGDSKASVSSATDANNYSQAGFFATDNPSKTFAADVGANSAGIFTIGDAEHIATGFFESMKNRMGVGTPEQNANDTYERGMDIVPDCIRAEENEVPVKQYNVAVLRNLLKLERSEGRLQVTNKRVIFRATGRSIRGRVSLQNEFAISEIGGIEARRNYKFSFLYLVFAFLISMLSYIVVTIIFLQKISLPTGGMPFAEVANGGMLFPSHVQKAYEAARTAASQTMRAETEVQEAGRRVKAAERAEDSVAILVRDGVRKTRSVQSGTDYWTGRPTFRNQSYMDTTQATRELSMAALKRATEERRRAENAEEEAVKKLDEARQYQAEMERKRNRTENTWKFLMTIFGFILGVGGLIPFFMLYQRFGLKLFILGFSQFGFVLSLTASANAFFYLFIFISSVIGIICTIIYCFRPNLVISIKNKSGMGEVVDVRRDKSCWPFSLFISVFEEKIGFYEVIPTEESESAIRELGAMIGDIQKMGDLGLEKWMAK